MAAPLTKTLYSLSGAWQLNKSCSDDFASVLAIQGVKLLVRKAATTASIHLKITLTQPDEQHVQMEQQITSGKLSGTSEDYTLDWEWRKNKDSFFGEIAGRSRWIGVEDAEGTEVVANGEGACWIEGDSNGKLIEAQGTKDDGAWEAHHLWGFEMVDGARRHTRRVYVKNEKGKEVRVRMVYDFMGE